MTTTTMSPVQPKLYHITHVDNLPSILASHGLWSDATMMARVGPTASIGMGEIKRRRLDLPVRCHPGDRVGDYVPFYFCPRSVMLYVIYRGNLPGMTYHGGQTPILHLEADLRESVTWAESEGHRWAFTLSNAGAYYAEFRNHLCQINEVDWAAVSATDFRDPAIKEGKQAEFLVRDFFAWHLVQRIGVYSPLVYGKVQQVITKAAHRPSVEIRREWYY